MSDPGFMIPLNQDDYDFKAHTIPNRNICSPADPQAQGNAGWWTNQNIQLTVGGIATSTATVGQQHVIQVGVQGLPAQDGDTPTVVQNVQAWVCYPNTVAGRADASLVVPSMQPPNKFASFTDMTENAPMVFGGGDYQDTGGVGFKWLSLSSWTPIAEDFLDQSMREGHCCIIANAAGFADAEFDKSSNTWGGEQVGVVIANNNQLNNTINVCSSLYQGQRNIMIVNAPVGGMIKTGLTFLAGAPTHVTPTRMEITVTPINQHGQINPALLNILSSGRYAGLQLKPASSPPKSLRLVQHKHQWRGWLAKIIHEAEEILEELIGLDEHPFGGGHRLKLHVPPHGLQPLRVEIEVDPTEPLGTVHAVEITQTNANGARGGITLGVVVLP
ncbi:MAG TPA: hypothetical protein VKY19_26905 [Ktedonosporobacter sp.]|jgi:hypothetical protein|nr:hypothetical protein [Ktedonosporobacter sp.]